jgi:AraC-like DNA-binding protein
MENRTMIEVVDWHGPQAAVVLQPLPVDDAHTSSGMISVLAAAEELARCHSLERMLFRAVELARTSIGLERVSLLVYDEASGVLRGTWGTGPDGELVDERHLQRPYGDVEREAHRRVEAGVGRWLQLRDAPHVSHHTGKAELLGHGWQVLTPVRSLRSALGILYNDTALGKAPLDPSQQVRAAVFASLIGNVIQAMREPAPLTRSLPPNGAKYGALVRRAIAALNEDPTVTADKLALQLRASSARLARAFRSELGVSLVQYRNRLRLERFFGLVEQQGGNFSEAAQTAGFGSYAQFHRIFRQQVGVTPREYLAGRRHAV